MHIVKVSCVNKAFMLHALSVFDHIKFFITQIYMLPIKLYGLGAIVAPSAKNAALTTFTEIVLVHFILNVAFKTRKHFQMAGY